MAWTTPKTWAFQEGVESAELNTHLRDNLLAVGPHLIVRKPSDESLSSNTTLQDDDHLILPVGANEVWQVQWFILADCGPGGMNIGWTWPSGGYLSLTGRVTSGTLQLVMDGTSPAGPFSLGSETAGDRKAVPWSGVYVNGGTGGNVTLQWAQTSSSGTATIMKANSTLWAVKLA